MNAEPLRSFATALAVAPALAQPAIDYAREDRWAQEVVPSIVVGEAVWLATPARAQSPRDTDEPAGASKGGVIVIHGLGVHPDFGMIGGVRTAARRSGLYDAVGADAGACCRRLARRLCRRAARGRRTNRARRSRSCARRGLRRSPSSRTAWARRWRTPTSRGRDVAKIDAWVPIGMLVDFASPPKEPVRGHHRRERVGAGRGRRAGAREAAAARRLLAASSRSPGPDHYFENRQKELAAAIAAFLDRVFSGAAA